jgi:hypothetical protein
MFSLLFRNANSKLRRRSKAACDLEVAYVTQLKVNCKYSKKQNEIKHGYNQHVTEYCDKCQECVVAYSFERRQVD